MALWDTSLPLQRQLTGMAAQSRLDKTLSHTLPVFPVPRAIRLAIVPA